MIALLFGRRGNKRKEIYNFFVLLLDWEKGKRKERSIDLLNYKSTFQKLKYNKKTVQIRERKRNYLLVVFLLLGERDIL